MIFRCNASPTIGLGHLFRCRTLASALKKLGEHSLMIGPSKKYKSLIDHSIFLKWFPRKKWISSEDDAKYIVKIASNNSTNKVILDDYRIDEIYQKILKINKIKWLQFDGAINKNIWANFILNMSPAISLNDYNHVAKNPNSQFLLGPKFALVREEFLTVIRNQNNKKVKKIFVMFGGGDDQGGILKVSKILLNELGRDVHIFVVLGKHNPRIQEIKKWFNLNADSKIDLFIDPPSIGSIIVKSDIAIITGGGTVYEVAYFGIPMLLIAIAENQVRHSMAWERIKAAKFLGKLQEIKSQSLISEVKKTLSNLNKDRYDNRNLIVDGLGAHRVAKIFLNKVA